MLKHLNFATKINFEIENQILISCIDDIFLKLFLSDPGVLGPIFVPGCLSVTHSLRHLCET